MHSAEIVVGDFNGYPENVDLVFADMVNYGQIIKAYTNTEQPGRYGPPEVVGTTALRRFDSAGLWSGLQSEFRRRCKSPVQVFQRPQRIHHTGRQCKCHLKCHLNGALPRFCSMNPSSRYAIETGKRIATGPQPKPFARPQVALRASAVSRRVWGIGGGAT